MENNQKEPLTCNVCFDNPTQPVVSMCGHLFWYFLCILYISRSCIREWLNRNNTQCPVCRSTISKRKLVPIFTGDDSRSSRRLENPDNDDEEIGLFPSLFALSLIYSKMPNNLTQSQIYWDKFCNILVYILIVVVIVFTFIPYK